MENCEINYNALAIGLMGNFEQSDIMLLYEKLYATFPNSSITLSHRLELCPKRLLDFILGNEIKVMFVCTELAFEGMEIVEELSGCDITEI